MTPNPPAPSQNEVPDVLPETLPVGTLLWKGTYRTTSIARREGEHWRADMVKLDDGKPWPLILFSAGIVDWSSVAALTKQDDAAETKWNEHECAVCGGEMPSPFSMRVGGAFSGAYYCKACYIKFKGGIGPDFDRQLDDAIRARRSHPAQSRGGEGPSAEWLAGARELLDRLAWIVAIHWEQSDPSDRNRFWWAEDGSRNVWCTHRADLDRERMTRHPEALHDGFRCFTRAELLALDPAADAGETVKEAAGGSPKTPSQLIDEAIKSHRHPGAPYPLPDLPPGTLVTVPGFGRKEPLAYVGGLRVERRGLGIVLSSRRYTGPDSLQSRFPMSHAERCGFCSDPIGAHQWVKFGAQKWHDYCAEQNGRRHEAELDAEHEAYERGRIARLPTCLCGATIFRAFKRKDFSGGDVLCCAECHIKANPPPLSAGSDRVADVGGGHPQCWPEGAHDDVGEL